MKKVNKKNLIMLMIHLMSMLIVLYDLTIITIKLNSCWSAFGLITFCISAILMELTYEYLNKKSVGISYTSTNTNNH